jgi:BioD-like phosphotransacetylase family protein
MEYDFETVEKLSEITADKCIIATQPINELHKACVAYMEAALNSSQHDIDVKLSIDVEQQEELERLFKILNNENDVPAYQHKGIFELIQTVTESLDLAVIQIQNEIQETITYLEEQAEHEQIERQLVQS